VGTRQVTVGRSAATAATNDVGSNAGRIASDAPVYSAGSDTKVPARWKFGMTIRPMSSEFQFTDGSVAAVPNHRIKAPCEIGTPLGPAVVPDV